MPTNGLVNSKTITDIFKELYGDYLLEELELVVPTTPGLVFTPKSCSHSWKEYVGFTDSYKYCETCGIKHEPEKDSK